MAKKLTIKQEIFCQEYIANNGNGTKAYMKAFDCKNMKEATINNNAYKMLKRDDIKTRIEELRQPLKEKFKYDINTAMNNFEEIRMLALEKGDLQACIKCEENKSKLMGLFAPQKVENINPPQTTIIIKGKK